MVFDRTGVTRSSGPDSGDSAAAGPETGGLLRLQGLAGNGAVRRVVVQRNTDPPN